MYSNLPEQVRIHSPRHPRVPCREAGPGQVPLHGREALHHVQQSPWTSKDPFTLALPGALPRGWTWAGTSMWEGSLASCTTISLNRWGSIHTRTPGYPTERLDLDGYLYPKVPSQEARPAQGPLYGRSPPHHVQQSPWTGKDPIHPSTPRCPAKRLDLDGYLYMGSVPCIMYNNLPEQVRIHSPWHLRAPCREAGPGRVPLYGRLLRIMYNNLPKQLWSIHPALPGTLPRGWTWTGTFTWEGSPIIHHHNAE